MAWDSGYQFGLPASHENPIWSPYRLYAQVDGVYSPNAVGLTRAWGIAQSVMNCVELGLQAVIFLRLMIAGRNDPAAFLLTCIVLSMTCAKTLTYFVLEHFNGWESVGPAAKTMEQLMLLYVLPNSVWIVVPGLSVLALLGEFSSAMTAKDKLT